MNKGLSKILLALTIYFSVGLNLNGQSSFIESGPIEVPPSIKRMVSDSIISCYEIDFSGNGIADYLVTSTPFSSDGYDKHLWWIRDDLFVYKRQNQNTGDVEIYKFINLDQDLELETISAFGYEDGIDYTIEDRFYQSADSIKQQLYFTPVIESSECHFFGYAWDWTDLIMEKSRSGIKVMLKHSLTRAGVVHFPENYEMPVLFFNGEPKRVKLSRERLNGKTEWLTLQQLFGLPVK